MKTSSDAPHHGRYRSTSSGRVTPRYCQVSVEWTRTRYSLVVSTVQPDPGSVLYFTNVGGLTRVVTNPVVNPDRNPPDPAAPNTPSAPMTTTAKIASDTRISIRVNPR